MLNEKEEKNMKNFSSQLNLSIREPQISKYGGDTRSVYVPSPPIIHPITHSLNAAEAEKYFVFVEN